MSDLEDLVELLVRRGVATVDPYEQDECCGLPRDEDGFCTYRPGHPIYIGPQVEVEPRDGEERWRDVAGYEGTYWVSDHGRMKSARRAGWKGGLLRARISHNGHGYWQVTLQKTDIAPSVRYVHHLVMEAFVGPRPDGMEVRHLDGDRLNANLTNLVYSTHAENLGDKRRHGTDHNVNKTHCPQGHPYDEENTYILPSRPTARYCRACQRDRRTRAKAS